VLQLERLRRVPRQFSWVDQRLVREGFIDRCDPPAAALYLFLVTVGDAQGLSYYGEAALCRQLQLTAGALCAARDRLIGADLIAFQAPLYQVLALPSLSSIPRSTSTVKAPTTLAAQQLDRAEARIRLQRVLEQLGGRRGRL
jgi:hypothetical protein